MPLRSANTCRPCTSFPTCEYDSRQGLFQANFLLSSEFLVRIKEQWLQTRRKMMHRKKRAQMKLKLGRLTFQWVSTYTLYDVPRSSISINRNTSRLISVFWEGINTIKMTEAGLSVWKGWHCKDDTSYRLIHRAQESLEIGRSWLWSSFNYLLSKQHIRKCLKIPDTVNASSILEQKIIANLTQPGKERRGVNQLFRQSVASNKQAKLYHTEDWMHTRTGPSCPPEEHSWIRKKWVYQAPSGDTPSHALVVT